MTHESQKVVVSSNEVFLKERRTYLAVLRVLAKCVSETVKISTIA